MTESLRGGRYVVTKTLGEGAQGTTLEAVDKREGRLVAIKRFEVKSAKSWKDVELAEREARVLSSLSHPSLPKYVEHFEEGGALYLVMERIEGESLAALRKRGVSFGPTEAWRFLEDAALALAYLHGRSPPIVHRDLKPGNVIRRPDGHYAFVDFGAVRDRLRPEGGSTVVGTFGYMAPEQFQGRALPQSDVYAIGATALSLLTGAEPEELPHQGLKVDVAAALGSSADPRLVRCLEAMLEPDPDERAPAIGPVLSREAGGDRAWSREPDAHRAPLGAPMPPEHHDGLDHVLAVARRLLGVLWVTVWLAWWWLPARAAFAYTMLLVLFSVATRGYGPRRVGRFERKKRERRRHRDERRIRVEDAEATRHGRQRYEPYAEETEEEEGDERGRHRHRHR